MNNKSETVFLFGFSTHVFNSGGQRLYKIKHPSEEIWLDEYCEQTYKPEKAGYKSARRWLLCMALGLGYFGSFDDRLKIISWEHPTKFEANEDIHLQELFFKNGSNPFITCIRKSDFPKDNYIIKLGPFYYAGGPHLIPYNYSIAEDEAYMMDLPAIECNFEDFEIVVENLLF